MACLVDYLVHANGEMGAEEDKPILEFRSSMKNRVEGKWQRLGNVGLPAWHFNVSYNSHLKPGRSFKKISIAGFRHSPEPYILRTLQSGTLHLW